METQIPQDAPAKKTNPLIIVAVIAGILLCCCVIGAAAFFMLNSNPLGNLTGGASDSSYSGRADELLRSDTMLAIAGYEASAYGCETPTLAAGQVMIPPAQSSDAWVEVWTVDACGATHTYEVTFTPSPGGGTDYSVSPLDQ